MDPTSESKSELRARLTSASAVLERNRWARFFLVFLVILGLKWDTLLQPPVWDTAMGLFPSALTLAENGFDLLELLAMPGYVEGGPKAHSTSVVTLATAAVLRISGGGTNGFLILHLLQLAGASVALLALFHFARPLLGGATAVLLCVSVLLHPIFSTQAGYLYLEMPLFLFTVLALLAWTRGRFWPSVLWATAALATKRTGIIVPATLALAALLERRSPPDKARRVAKILVFPALWTAGVFLLGRIAVARSDDFTFVRSFDGVLGGLGQYLGRFLLNVPDLLVFITIFFVAAIVSLAPIIRSLRCEPLNVSERPREHREFLVLGYSGVLIVAFILLFTVALPVTVGYTMALPRYYVMILPFLLLWVGYGVKRLLGHRLMSPAAVCFVLLSVFFALNTNGALYPLDIDTEGPGNDPPLTERSNAYRRLQTLEMAAIQALEELPDGVPVYYGHYEHYLLAYPGLGYSNGPPVQRAQLLRGVLGRVDQARTDAALCLHALQLPVARWRQDPRPDPLRRDHSGSVGRSGA